MDLRNHEPDKKDKFSVRENASSRDPGGSSWVLISEDQAQGCRDVNKGGGETGLKRFKISLQASKG